MSEAAPPPVANARGKQNGAVGPKELLALISATMALMALAIDLMLPAFDEIREAFDLGEGSSQAGRVITVFFLGLAVAQLFYGPLADRFGRKPILYVGLTVYTLGAIGSAMAPTFGTLLLFRFIWGVGAAGSRVVAVAIVRDRFEGNAMARAMSQIMAIFVLAPVFAPTIGALIIAVAPWRGVFWFCVVWAILIGLWFFRLPETLAPEKQRPLDVKVIASGMAEVARTRVTAGYTVATVFLQAVFTSYLASSELIISEVLGRGDQFPIVFGSVAIFFGMAALLNGRLVGSHGMYKVTHVALRAYVGCALALLTVTLVGGGNPPFWVFMPVLGLNLALTMFLMPNLNTAALDPMGELAGTASSLTGAARMAGGALLGAAIDSRMDATSLTPFAVGVVIFALSAAVSVAITEWGRTPGPDMATGH